MKPMIVYGLPLMLASATASAGPVLLASVDVHGGQGGTFPPVDQRVAFVLTLFPEFTPDTKHDGLGDDVFWGDGAVGFVDFTVKNEDDFANFADLATNGVNNFYLFFAQLAGGGGAGGGAPESNWFCPSYPCDDRPPDFEGFRLDSVRLLVHNLDFERFEPEPGSVVDLVYDLTYEFYGTPIPEPLAIALTIPTVVCWAARRVRAALGNTHLVLNECEVQP